MQQNFKLIPKFDKNLMAIYLVLPNGENRQILQCVFPNDNQMGDNVKVADELIPILRRRIKRSID